MDDNGDVEPPLLLCEEIEVLKQKLLQCEQLNSTLSRENNELRQYINLNANAFNGNANNGCSMNHASETAPPRKMARASNSSGLSIEVNRAEEACTTRSTGDVARNTTHIKNRKKVMQVIDSDVVTVRNVVKRTNCKNFSVKQSSLNGPVKVTISAEDEVSVVRDSLLNAKVSFHEYKWADEKAKCFVIRGLVGINDELLDSVKQELIESGLPENISLSLHVTGYMKARPEKRHNPPVKLLLPPGVDQALLDNIKFLNHISVRFEVFKAKSVIQCVNCQRFGHAASGCRHQHRCVKCGLNHLRDSCPRTSNTQHKLKCCNCGGEHTANNLKACEFYIKHFSSKVTLPSKASPGETAEKDEWVTVGASRRSGTSFAAALRGGTDNAKSSNFSNICTNAILPNRGKNLVRAPVPGAAVSADNELVAKLDKVYMLVLKHEKWFSRLFNNG